jgi:hypothetical protein
MLNDSHSLFDNFEYGGFWWSPKSPGHKVAGTLRYTVSQRMTLDLLGSLDESGSDENEDSDLILGTADGNRAFTLQGLIRTKSRSVGRKVFSSSYLVDRIFEGKHFSSTKDIKFTSVSVSYTSFEDWFADLPFHETTDNTDVPTDAVKLIASHVVPYPIFECRVDSLNSAIEAKLGFEGSIGIRELKWRSTGYIDIVPDEPSSFDWFWQVHADIRNLLTLLMNEPTYAKLMCAYGDAIETSPGRVSKERIYVYFMNSSGASQEEIHPADMLLIFPAIKDNISMILEAWFSKAELLRAVYTLFFGSMYFSHMYPRFHFLNLIQAVETFHRNMRMGQYLSEEAFEPIRVTLTTAIPNDIPRDFRESLKNKIRYGYEYSLRKRLRQLFAELEPETTNLITNNVTALIGKIVDTRNYFTHYTDELKKLAFEDDSVHYANYKLRVLLIVLLLKEVGLSEAVIRERVCRNRELLYGLSEGQGVKAFLAKLKASPSEA